MRSRLFNIRGVVNQDNMEGIIMDNMTSVLKNYILAEFLPGEDAENLTNDTPLISSGILDSLATLRLVVFLEEQFQIKIAPHETQEQYLGSIANIVDLIQSKATAQ
jgi:acyl carrier protein